MLSVSIIELLYNEHYLNCLVGSSHAMLVITLYIHKYILFAFVLLWKGCLAIVGSLTFRYYFCLNSADNFQSVTFSESLVFFVTAIS